MAIKLAIENWSACTTACQPGLELTGYLLDEQSATNVSFLPAIKRRRLSKLSKLSLRLAHECIADYQGYCVFGSQHGELVTTQKLLDSIVNSELLSPAGFSSSVHNTSAGLHSINNQNEFPCISIAAGRDTLAMCFLEAAALINSETTNQVLLVYADDCLPDELAGFLPEENYLRGFAALLAEAGQGPGLEMTPCEKTATAASGCQIGKLAEILADNTAGSSINIAGEGVDWNWQRYGK